MISSKKFFGYKKDCIFSFQVDNVQNFSMRKI